MEIVVDVIVATCSNCVLRVVIPAPARKIVPFRGMKNTAADKIIDMPFPMSAMMKTARTTPAARSMIDFICFPTLGTLLKTGTVMLVAAINVESETLLVIFWTTDLLQSAS